MKLYTKTFGCQMNTADSDEIGRHFRARGFEATDDAAAADVVLVNTCTVRDLAEHKAASYIGRLRDWKGAKPGGMIVVTGCAAERAKADFKRRFPHVDLIVGAKDIGEFGEELDKTMRNADHRLHGPVNNFELFKRDFGLRDENRSEKPHTDSSNSAFRNPHSAIASPNSAIRNPHSAIPSPLRSPVVNYVTIMRGCNYSCTYCIVPSVRGREAYRPVEDILADVRARVLEGAKEIYLLGQTVNSYRPSAPPRPGYDFADLLRDAAGQPGVERIRFMSPHPFYLTPNLIRAMAETPAAGTHLHLPVQSGSSEVLKRMRRNYTRESYLDGIRRLREAIPDLSLSTDLIVGFPGETEADFEATVSLVNEARFDSAYCFKYSPRPGTVAADQMTDDVPDSVKELRVNRLLALTDEQGRQRAESLVGTEQEVLIEDEKGGSAFRGKTRGAWRARLKGASLRLGQIVRVRITGSHSRELHAELI